MAGLGPLELPEPCTLTGPNSLDPKGSRVPQVVGEKEKVDHTVNVRTRDNKVHGMHALASVMLQLVRERDARHLASTFGEDSQVRARRLLCAQRCNQGAAAQPSPGQQEHAVSRRLSQRARPCCTCAGRGCHRAGSSHLLQRRRGRARGRAGGRGGPIAPSPGCRRQRHAARAAAGGCRKLAV